MVTTNDVFVHRFIQHRGTEAQSFYYFSVFPCLCVYQNTACGLRRYPNSVFHPMEQVIPSHGTKCSTPWNKQEGAASVGRRCRLRGSKVPPPWVEGAASVGRRCRLREAKVRASRVLVRPVHCFSRKKREKGSRFVTFFQKNMYLCGINQ